MPTPDETMHVEPERFDDEPAPRVVPPRAVDRYIRNLRRARALCDLADDAIRTKSGGARAKLAEIETELANVQYGLEHHLNNHRQKEACEQWQDRRDGVEPFGGKAGR